MPRVTKQQLPKAGDVFQFEVKSGVAMLFRCVAQEGDGRCVVLSRWFGEPRKTVPSSPSLFTVQPLKHHQWDRPMIGGWVTTPPPDAVVKLGMVKLRDVEPRRVLHPRVWVTAKKQTPTMARKVLPMASWDSLVRDARAQWRWKNEHAAVLAEDEAVQRAKLEAMAAEVIKMRGLDPSKL